MKLNLNSNIEIVKEYLDDWDMDKYTYSILKYMYKKRKDNGSMTIDNCIHRKDMPLWLKYVLKRDDYNIAGVNVDEYAAVMYLCEKGYASVMNEGNDYELDIEDVHKYEMIIEITRKGKVVVESRERELRRWAIPTSLSIIALVLGIVNLVIKLLE